MFEDAKVFLYGDGFINSQGYRELYRPNWHNANRQGYVRLHRYKYELMYGVKLTREEVVHHKDGCKLNNMNCNLERLTKKDHDRIEGFKHNEDIKRKCRQMFMASWRGLGVVAREFNLDRNTVAKYIRDLKVIRKKVLYRRYLRLRSKGFGLRAACRQIGVPAPSIYDIEKVYAREV